MPICNLTDRFCSGVKASERIDYFDEKTRGLCLRVTPNVKTFTLHFTAPNGKRARLTLGPYPDLSLARARTLAVEGLGKAGEGDDPRGQGANTVRTLAANYRKHTRTLRSGKAIERRLVKNVLPVIGDRPIEGLHKRDINRVLDPIIERGAPVEAARAFEDMRAMFRWGVSRGDLDHSPMEGMRKLAAAPPRERVLSDSELRKLWRSLPAALPRSVACQQIIKLCLLTAARVGEVCGMTRAEIDLAARAWTIPSSRSKNKHAHTVPLSDAAIAVIKEAKGETFLFPNNGHGALPAHAVAHTVRLAQARFGLAQWSMHDLRRSATTGMAKLGVLPFVIGCVLNHRSITKAGTTLSVYVRHSYESEARAALDLWADRVAGIVGGGASTVLPMRRKRRP